MGFLCEGRFIVVCQNATVATPSVSAPCVTHRACRRSLQAPLQKCNFTWGDARLQGLWSIRPLCTFVIYFCYSADSSCIPKACHILIPMACDLCYEKKNNQPRKKKYLNRYFGLFLVFMNLSFTLASWVALPFPQPTALWDQNTEPAEYVHWHYWVNSMFILSACEHSFEYVYILKTWVEWVQSMHLGHSYDTGCHLSSTSLNWGGSFKYLLMLPTLYRM